MTSVFTRLRLFRAGWMVCASIAVVATASAQGSLEAAQVVGNWLGTLQAAGRSPASVEVEFKPDGAFECASLVNSSLGMACPLPRSLTCLASPGLPRSPKACRGHRG